MMSVLAKNWTPLTKLSGSAHGESSSDNVLSLFICLTEGIQVLFEGLKIYSIIHLIKILGYSLELDQLFIKSNKRWQRNLIIHYSFFFLQFIKKKIGLFINF